jgi:hypothetical protein
MCVLAVPVAVASTETPRTMWMAEWIRPNVSTRTIGILTLRDGKLAFDEQAGPAEWSVDITSIKRVSIANNGKALSIVVTSGDEYLVTVMNPDLTIGSPKKVADVMERAIQAATTNGR